MPVALGARGQAGHDHPFEWMSDCHRRIEQFLSVIRRAHEVYSKRELEEEGARALRTAQRYFRESAPRHTEDEELSLFPRLRGLGRADLRGLLEAAERLELEHVEAERIHRVMDERIDRWMCAGRLTPGDAVALAHDLDALGGLYADHIAFEDRVLFPGAARALDEQDIKGIGEEMAARRGLDVGMARTCERIDVRRFKR